MSKSSVHLGTILVGLLLYLPTLISSQPAAAQDYPHLREQGDATQLIVDEEPFLMLGGELGNSSASSLEYMSPFWSKFEQMNLNTVVAPVYWELIEPEEGSFDFSLVDGLLDRARDHDMRLVLLWFGSWKNSMSSYVPAWVKEDQDRFPRAKRSDGTPMEILSPFSEASVAADTRAFEALMKHLREVDRDQQTVLMVQIENEIGMIPEARDHSEAATSQYRSEVPQALVETLQANRGRLQPALKRQWTANGAQMSGTWEEVFGEGTQTEELFTAWHFARYVERVATAGKEAYPLPMYVNAALIRPGEEPGDYPSGGPLPHLMDVWRAGAPSVDFLAPDIYFPNFSEWTQRYDQAGNPLFIPEAGRAGAETSASNALYTFGAHDALGYSPFSIEDAPADGPLSEAYDVLHQLAPLIKEHQGTDALAGVRAPVAYDGSIKDSSQTLTFGDYVFDATVVDPWVPREEQELKRHGALIIQRSPNEYLVAGSGVTFTFSTRASERSRPGILRIEEGEFVDGQWERSRVLNGDQSHQGRHLRLPPDQFGIQRLELYRYD